MNTPKCPLSMRNLLTQTEVGSDMTWTKNKCGSHYDKESDLRALLIDFGKWSQEGSSGYWWCWIASQYLNVTGTEATSGASLRIRGKDEWISKILPLHIKSPHSCHCILINFIGYVNSHHPYHTCLWRSKLHENVSLPGNVIARQIHFHEQGFPSQLETLGSLKGI